MKLYRRKTRHLVAYLLGVGGDNKIINKHLEQWRSQERGLIYFYIICTVEKLTF